MSGPHRHGHHAHDPFRDDHDIDWKRLAARQRERLPLADALWDLLGRPAGRRLADVGCGPGVLSVHYARLGAEVLAVDMRADALALVPRHPRVRTVVHDLEAAPLPAQADILVLSDVLHHARSPAQMLEHSRSSAATILVAEWDPRAPGREGPPLEARLAPEVVAQLLVEAGFSPQPPARASLEHYAVVADAS